MSARRSPAVLLQVGNLLAGVANSSVSVLVPWLVLQQTGSPAAAGLVTALSATPGILVAPFVGALVDRLGRRTVSIGSDALSALSVALFPLAERAGLLGTGMIAGLAVLGAVFDPAGYTARKSLIPDVARAGGYMVDRLNGVHEGIFAAGWVVGPALGALGISTIGVVGSFWITAAAFLAAMIAVAGIHVPEAIAESRRRAGEEAERFWASTLRGARVLWRDKPMLALTLAVCVLAMVYLPTESVVLPTYFEELGEPGGYGLTLTAVAAGAMLGSFGYGWLVLRMTRRQIVMTSVVTVTVGIIPMALLPPLGVFLSAGFLLGLGWGPMEPLLNTLVQTRVPPHVQGRVYGVQTSLFYAAGPAGLLVAGLAVERFGVQVVYAGIGGLMVATAVVMALLPSLRGLDDPPRAVAADD